MFFYDKMSKISMTNLDLAEDSIIVCLCFYTMSIIKPEFYKLELLGKFVV